MAAAKKGLYANIKAKHDRIAHGSGEKMREEGSAGAPAPDAFAKSEKTSKAAKKTSAKKTVAKKAATKKVAAKKAAKKTASKKTASKKVATKKTATRKVATARKTS